MADEEPADERRLLLDSEGEHADTPTGIDSGETVSAEQPEAAPVAHADEAWFGGGEEVTASRSTDEGVERAEEAPTVRRPDAATPAIFARGDTAPDETSPFDRDTTPVTHTTPVDDEGGTDRHPGDEPGYVLTEDTPRSSVGHLLDGEGRLDGLPESAARVTAGPRPLPRVLAVANQKGGVGKTTTAVNLGAALADLGYRVLVVDLDPQGNATTGLGIDARNFELSVYDVLMREMPLEDCVEPTSVKNLFVVPATIDLAGVEIELVAAFSRELRLRRAIDAIVDDFDFVLVDCPPSLGLLTVNGLAAAGEVLVPIQCEYYALEGLSQLLRNVHLVAGNLNEQLEVTTIVLTMYDGRTRLAVEVASEVRTHFTDRVCRTVIPRAVRLSEAPSFGQPITVFDPTSRGAVAYRELAKEVSNGAPKRAG